MSSPRRIRRSAEQWREIVSRFQNSNTPETSNHTSIKMRIERWKNASYNSNTAEHDPEAYDKSLQPNKLLPFIGNYRQPMPKGLAFHLVDYLE